MLAYPPLALMTQHEQQQEKSRAAKRLAVVLGVAALVWYVLAMFLVWH